MPNNVSTLFALLCGRIESPEKMAYTMILKTFFLFVALLIYEKLGVAIILIDIAIGGGGRGLLQ